MEGKMWDKFKELAHDVYLGVPSDIQHDDGCQDLSDQHGAALRIERSGTVIRFHLLWRDEQMTLVWSNGDYHPIAGISWDGKHGRFAPGNAVALIAEAIEQQSRSRSQLAPRPADREP